MRKFGLFLKNVTEGGGLREREGETERGIESERERENQGQPAELRGGESIS